MDKPPETPATFVQACELRHLGYRLVPLRPLSKIPLHKGYQTRDYTEEEWWHLCQTDSNVGLLCGGDLVVLDIDSTDAADLEWIIARVGDTPMKVRSPSGGLHFYFRARAGVEYGNGVKLRGKPYDLRWSGAFIVCPPSIGENGKPYLWLGDRLPAKKLPFMKVTPLRERKPKPLLRAIEPSETVDGMVKRARAYLACVEGAISGQRGHDRTMRVAGVLVQKFGLSIEQALPLMREWNEQCEPSWSEKELLHKLQDAVRLRFVRGLRPID